MLCVLVIYKSIRAVFQTSFTDPFALGKLLEPVYDDLESTVVSWKGSDVLHPSHLNAMKELLLFLMSFVFTRMGLFSREDLFPSVRDCSVIFAC